MKALRLLLVFSVILLMICGCSRSDKISKIDIQKALVAVRNATEKYENDFAKPPRDVFELIDKDLLKIKSVVLKEWEIEIVWPEEVVAYSTVDNPGIIASRVTKSGLVLSSLLRKSVPSSAISVSYPSFLSNKFNIFLRSSSSSTIIILDIFSLLMSYYI